jgi:hypothetical protein
VIYTAWMDEHTAQTRKPRADALRNRERVLEAAKAVFNAGGPEASLEAVAKRAGVGIGTLYRHFPRICSRRCTGARSNTSASLPSS